MIEQAMLKDIDYNQNIMLCKCSVCDNVAVFDIESDLVTCTECGVSIDHKHHVLAHNLFDRANSTLIGEHYEIAELCVSNHSFPGNADTAYLKMTNRSKKNATR